MRVDLVVQRELVVAQVKACEERILVEKEIRDCRAPKQVELRQAANLIDALKQEVELGRQGEARHVGVEPGKKRILFRCLEQCIAVEVEREGAGKARLAGANRPL